MSILGLTLCIMGLLSIIAIVIMLPNKTTTNRMLISEDAKIDKNVQKIMKVFGGDVLAATPKSLLESQVYSPKIDKLFRDSGNPWKVTPQEFFLMKILYGIGGILTAFLITGALYAMGYGKIFYILAWSIPFIFFAVPQMTYSKEAKHREKRFKIELPEAIDYLTMALSGGGYALSSAFEEATGYIRPGIVRDEFETIVQDLRAGKTMEAALTAFAERAPMDSIQTFTKALINANNLSVSMTEILKIRAAESRKDLEAEIEEKVAKLPAKTTMILSPTSIFAVVLIGVAPSLASIAQLM